MDKTGLVLEGGANRGIFTAGVLDYFREQGWYTPYVVSVSIGSCNAMDYVSRQIGRTKSCMLPNGRNAPPIHWKHLRHKKTMVDMDLVFDTYPNQTVPFDYDTYFASDIISEYVVTNCISGRAEYLTEAKDRRRLMTIGRASCSMPYISPMVTLDGVPYLDGGIADAIPLRRAIKMGYKKNIVILTREKGYIKKDSRAARLLNKKFYSEYPQLVRQLEHKFYEYNETLRYVESLESKGQVLLIRPSKILAGRMDNKPAHLEAFYKQGYEMAKARSEEIRSFLYGGAF